MARSAPRTTRRGGRLTAGRECVPAAGGDLDARSDGGTFPPGASGASRTSTAPWARPNACVPCRLSMRPHREVQPADSAQWPVSAASARRIARPYTWPSPIGRARTFLRPRPVPAERSSAQGASYHRRDTIGPAVTMPTVARRPGGDGLRGGRGGRLATGQGRGSPTWSSRCVPRGWPIDRHPVCVTSRARTRSPCPAGDDPADRPRRSPVLHRQRPDRVIDFRREAAPSPAALVLLDDLTEEDRRPARFYAASGQAARN